MMLWALTPQESRRKDGGRRGWDARHHFKKNQREHYVKTRDHVLELHRVAGSSIPPHIVWPVDRHMRNMLPDVNLQQFREFQDVSWQHIVPEI